MKFDRGLKEIIEVIKFLKPKHPSIKFKIVGETYNEERAYLSKKIKEYGLEDNIIETGWLTYENVGDELKNCSIGLITNTSIERNTLAGPANKFFNYLTYGIACVAVDLPETTALLRDTKAGITIQERTIEKLSEAIDTLLTDNDRLSNYCKKAYEAYQQYNWKNEEQKLISFYKNVVLNEKGVQFY